VSHRTQSLSDHQTLALQATQTVCKFNIHQELTSPDTETNKIFSFPVKNMFLSLRLPRYSTLQLLYLPPSVK